MGKITVRYCDFCGETKADILAGYFIAKRTRKQRDQSYGSSANIGSICPNCYEMLSNRILDMHGTMDNYEFKESESFKKFKE